MQRPQLQMLSSHGQVYKYGLGEVVATHGFQFFVTDNCCYTRTDGNYYRRRPQKRRAPLSLLVKGVEEQRRDAGGSVSLSQRPLLGPTINGVCRRSYTVVTQYFRIFIFSLPSGTDGVHECAPGSFFNNHGSKNKGRYGGRPLL